MSAIEKSSTLGKALIAEGAKEYVIDDAELERVQREYPVIWKDPSAKPKLCFVGCPHLSLEQLKDWTVKLEEELKKNGKKKVTVKTVFTAAPAVLRAFGETEYAERLRKTGVITSYGATLTVLDTKKTNGIYLHQCQVENGSVKLVVFH